MTGHPLADYIPNESGVRRDDKMSPAAYFIYAFSGMPGHEEILGFEPVLSMRVAPACRIELIESFKLLVKFREYFFHLQWFFKEGFRRHGKKIPPARLRRNHPAPMPRRAQCCFAMIHIPWSVPAPIPHSRYCR